MQSSPVFLIVFVVSAQSLASSAVWHYTAGARRLPTISLSVHFGVARSPTAEYVRMVAYPSIVYSDTGTAALRLLQMLQTQSTHSTEALCSRNTFVCHLCIIGMRFKHPLFSGRILWLGLFVCPHGFSKCFFSVISCPIELIF